MTDRAHLRGAGVEVLPANPLETIRALQRVDLRARPQHDVRAVVDSLDEVA